MAAKHSDANAELERRVAEATLRDEVLGDAPLLGLIRDALDRYVAACKRAMERDEEHWPVHRAVGYRNLLRGYDLRGWWATAIGGQPVTGYRYTFKPRRSETDMDVGNATLRLHAEVHKSPERARALLRAIERAIQKLE